MKRPEQREGGRQPLRLGNDEGAKRSDQAVMVVATQGNALCWPSWTGRHVRCGLYVLFAKSKISGSRLAR